jgi:hypothetical protein
MPRTHRGDVHVQLQPSSTRALEERGRRHNPVTLPQEKRPGTHRIGSWVGLGVGLDGSSKSRPPPPPGLEPQTVQPVVSRNTDCAIPVQ